MASRALVELDPADMIATWTQRHAERREAAMIRSARRWLAFCESLSAEELVALLAAAERDLANRRHRGLTDL